jgi:hypothetical protein
MQHITMNMALAIYLTVAHRLLVTIWQINIRLTGLGKKKAPPVKKEDPPPNEH